MVDSLTSLESVLESESSIEKDVRSGRPLEQFTSTLQEQLLLFKRIVVPTARYAGETWPSAVYSIKMFKMGSKNNLHWSYKERRGPMPNAERLQDIVVERPLRFTGHVFSTG